MSRDYDSWLQSAGAYEKYAGLSGPTEEEQREHETDVERRIDERIEDAGGA